MEDNRLIKFKGSKIEYSSLSETILTRVMLRVIELRRDLYKDTMSELSSRIGSVATYRQYEYGIAIIPLYYLYRISLLYSVSISYFYELTVVPPKLIKNIHACVNKSISERIFNESVGRVLRHIKITNGLNTLDMAIILNMNESSGVGKLENGKKRIKVIDLYLLSKEFDISIDDLFSKLISQEKV
jgi:transcriptional regulator with XRE-family HTH domain